MKKNVVVFLFVLCGTILSAQEKTDLRSLTLDEYQKAKTFSVKDLDNDTYVKFDNTYVLDRYESRKPYFITGDDGKKKRMDLYRLLLKDGMRELGTVIFYTNEANKHYQAVLPGFRSDAKVWEKYFEDIHAIDREEANFVLKLSYVLSKEFGFQLYKAANQGKDLSKESGTYGSDICFPGNTEVAMADGTKKMLTDIKQGDQIFTLDPLTKTQDVTEVKELVSHEEKNYAITHLVLLCITEIQNTSGIEVQLLRKELKATPNHPVITSKGEKKIGEIREGETIECFNKEKNTYESYLVWSKDEKAGGVQKVFNIVAKSGENFIMNEVVVQQKESAKSNP